MVCNPWKGLMRLVYQVHTDFYSRVKVINQNEFREKPVFFIDTWDC